MSFCEDLLPHNAIWAMSAFTLAVLAGLSKKWIKKIIHSCSTEYPKGPPYSDADKDAMIDDLEHISCTRGIGNLWNETARDGPLTILLTGASGYLGQLIVFMLLRRIQNDTSENKSNHKILLLVRPKKGRKTAQERAERIKNMHIFDSVRGVWDHVIQVVETSDMNLPNAGIADESIAMLNEAKVTHLIHCAADVGFTKTLDELASVNIASSLHLQKLTHQWPSCKRMVYVSTAFVNPEQSTPEKHLHEHLVDLGGYDPLKLYESMKGDCKLAEQVMKERGFVNNYVFTKCVSEHLICRDAKTELAIVRPAVVGPAWIQPLAGWNGEKPSTASTLGLLIMSRMTRVCPVSDSAFPCVPVDVCALGVVHAMISPNTNKGADQQVDRINFRNLIWSASSPIQFPSSGYSLNSLLQYSVAKGLISRVEAAFATFFSLIVSAFPVTIPVLHQIFNRGPLLMPYYTLLLLEKIGLVKKGLSSDLKLLMPFVDVVRLYEPFVGGDFYFESSMHVPASFNFDFYGEGLCMSIHNFMTLMREKNEAKKGKIKSEKQNEKTNRESYPLLPPNWYVFVLIPLALALVYFCNLLVALFLVYLVMIPLNPVMDLQLLFALWARALSGGFADLPLRFNVAGLGQICWGIVFRGPFELFLWYLDELLFPGYKACPVENPVFMLGQPRSGTTKLLDVMALDSERFCALTLSEIRFPYLCLHYAIDFISNFDKNYFGNSLAKFMKEYGLDSPMPGTVPERETMRRISWNLHDEDEAIFVYHGICHFMLAGFFPDPDLIHRVYQFDTLSERSRRRFLRFHRKAVQKVLYRRGAGRTYMAKWVAGWNGQLDQAKIEYPDAKFVVIARDRKGSLRSWMKLQSLLSLELSGNNIMDIPEAKQTVINVNKNWYQKEIEFCKSTPDKSLHVLRFNDFVNDIPKEISRICDFLGKKIDKGSRFDYALQAEHKKQSAHKKTIFRGHELYLSDEQIENEFPDLLAQLHFS